MEQSGASARCRATWRERRGCYGLVPSGWNGFKWFNLALDGLGFLVTGQAQVVVGLQAGPYFSAGAEVAGQAQGGVGGGGAVFEEGLIGAAGWGAHRRGGGRFG